MILLFFLALLILPALSLVDLTQSTTEELNCQKLKDGLYADPLQDCTYRYYRCKNTTRTALLCDLSLRFDALTKTCRTPSLVPACSSSSADSDSLQNLGNSVRLAQATRIGGVNCAQLPNGNYEDPQQPCNAIFYQCSNGRLRTRSCDPGLVYDAVTDRCLTQDRVESCNAAVVVTPPTVIVRPAVGTGPVYNCSGVRDGTYASYSGACDAWYFRCTASRSTRLRCSIGTVFDQPSRTCLPPGSVEACQVLEIIQTTQRPFFDCTNRRDGRYALYQGACDNQFALCTRGVASQQRCRSGTVFDQDTTGCLDSRYVRDCGGTPTRRIVATTQPAITFDCTTRADGVYAFYPGACDARFYICSGRSTTGQRCASGTVFDQQSRRCLNSNYVQACGGTPTIRTPATTRAPVTIFPLIDFDCTTVPDGDYADPRTTCSRYYITCARGRASVRTCATNSLRFDPRSGRCLQPSFIVACGGTAFQTTRRPQPTRSSIAFDCTNQLDGFYPNPSQACDTMYFGCSGAIATMHSCAAQLKFDSVSGDCLSSIYVEACGGTPTPKTAQITYAPIPPPDGASCDTKVDGFYGADLEPCSNQYYACANGQVIGMECALPQLRYDSLSNECMAGVYVEACGGTPTTRAPDPVRPRQPVNFDCTELGDGYYTSPSGGSDACSNVYYACVGGIANQMECPANLMYDVESESCLHRVYIRACGGNPTPKPAPYQPGITNEIGTLQVISATGGTFDCLFRTDGFYPNPRQRCSDVFYECRDGQTTRRRCRAPLRFDVATGTCRTATRVESCN